jgi:hypothetical protein
MSGAVAGLTMLVARAHQYRPIRPDQNRAERMIARCPRLLRNVEREPQIILVCQY